MSDLDDLMDKDPLSLSDADLDKIIAYERKYRAQLAQGIKPKRESGPKVSIEGVLTNLIKKPVVPTIKRRV